MNVSTALALYEASNPFCDQDALRGSNYSAWVDGELVRLLDFKRPAARATLTHAALRRFIQSAAYPCVGARSVVNRSTYRFGYYGAMIADAVAGLARDLCAFVAELKATEPQFSSFIAAFQADPRMDEDAFESALWDVLSRLRTLDQRYFEYAPSANPDPATPDYAFSFAEEGLFVVGMHPRASRAARRFAYPMLVFNPHRQFTRLRETGGWQPFQKTIRSREMALQGSLNPNLAEYGSASEARQYSGKPVSDQWKCPFHQP